MKTLKYIFALLLFSFGTATAKNASMTFISSSYYVDSAASRWFPIMGHFPGDVGAATPQFSTTILPAGVITHLGGITGQPDSPHGTPATTHLTVWVNFVATAATCSFSDLEYFCEWIGAVVVPEDAHVNIEMGEVCGGACPNGPVMASIVFTPTITNWPFLTEEDHSLPKYIARAN